MVSKAAVRVLDAQTSGQAVIEVFSLSKSYKRGSTVRQWLLKGALGSARETNQASSDEVQALTNTTFSVRRGEAFGVIGRNGAGKSTLLQILAGTLQPTSGSCIVRGRVTALLELGSGFNPEFTGRENIYLAGGILGIAHEAMARRFNSIVAFADIGDFIDQPVKTYSTGMLMRVAFSVAISVEPDVLIIDEALSVGDILFQQKCSRRLKELVQQGVTLLVVTHDLSFVLSMCQRAIWLDRGKVRYLGDAGNCVREYVAAMAAASGNAPIPSDDLAANPDVQLPEFPELSFTGKERLGDGAIRISRAWLAHSDGSPGGSFRVGEWATVVIVVAASKSVKGVSAGCELRNRHGQVVFATGLRVAKRLVSELAANESCCVTIKFRLELQEGQYTMDLGCGAGSDSDNTWDRVLNAAVIDIHNPPDQEIVHGLVRLPYEITVGRLGTPAT